MKEKFFKTLKYKQYKKLSFADRLNNYLDEADILKVPVSLTKDKMVRVNWLSGLTVEGAAKKGLVRKSVLKKLQKINQRLWKRYKLRIKIYEMYRPLEKQRLEFGQISEQLRSEFPKLTKKKLWTKITQFIADPDLCPPHSTGGAVDLTLYDPRQKVELAMGTPINAIDEKAAIFHPKITDQAKKNREILLLAMIEEGFAPMCTEWWHFSYGDAYWAALYDQKRIFDKLDL